MENKNPDNDVSDQSKSKRPEKQDESLSSTEIMKFQTKQMSHIYNEMTKPSGNKEDEKEKVAEQVEEDGNSKSLITNIGDEDELEESYSGPETLVRDWESDHNQKLPTPARKLALLAASIHLGEGRGILVSDLEKQDLERFL